MLRRVLPALVLATLAACEMPSGIPNWETTWNVPSQNLSVGVSQVLPDGVALSSDGTAFLVTVAPVTMTARLADDCPECVASAGNIVEKPAFTARTTASVVLPSDVQGGTLVAGAQLTMRVSNGNTFDPLRPAAGKYGWMTLVVRNGTTVLARDSLNGSTTTLPAGGQLVRALTLAGATVSGSVTVDVVVNSPAGDAVLIDPSRTVQITATPAPLRVTQATVAVRGVTVTQSTDVDLDVSSSVTDRAQSGRLLVAVKDPFSIRGPLSVQLTAPGVSLRRSIDVAGGDRTYALDFTRDEIRSLLGRTVAITFSGPVSTPGMLTVTPAQSIAIGTRFELVLTTNN